MEKQREDTRLIIKELLKDGGDPNALYIIEHHLSAKNFEAQEKAALEAFKLGFEVTDAEELEIEDGLVVISCDVIIEVGLNAKLIDTQVEQLVALAERCGVTYDGWGTYF
jgi:regulator of RNase E activity RraB